MKLLIVSATTLEIKPLLTSLGKGRSHVNQITRYKYKHFEIDVLITGVGMVPTAVLTSIALCQTKYEVAINAGICGSFNHQIALGEVLNIVSDCLPETGAEDGEHFLSLIDLNLLDKDQFPFDGGWLTNDNVFESNSINQLKKATGVTVNTVHGNSHSIKNFIKRNKTDVESMEGAAFMYSCKMKQIKHLQIRSVSNYIEVRDISKWDIPLAIKILNEFLWNLLNE